MVSEELGKRLHGALKKEHLLAAVIGFLLPRIAERIWENPALTNVALFISWGMLTYLIWAYLPQLFPFRGRLGRLAITSLASVVVAAVVYNLLWKRADHFTIMFSDTELNGQTIPLTKYDPLRKSQVFVEPNIQDLFTIQGIWARSDGAKALEAEAVYLSFSNAVTTRAGYEGQWRPSQVPAGWSTTYVTYFNKNSVEPGHPLAINVFSGGPIPHSPLKARVTLTYGSSTASAEFTITP